MNFQRNQDGSVYIDIDQGEGYRLPTHQEYQIIRDLLGLPEDRQGQSEHRIVIPNAKIDGRPGTFTMTATGVPGATFGPVNAEIVDRIFGRDAQNLSHEDPTDHINLTRKSDDWDVTEPKP
jgi:hypothetical protein